MSRTTTAAVIELMAPGDDYDLDGNPTVQPYIDTASPIVDQVVLQAKANGRFTISPALAEIIERWLAAHFYCMSDQTYASKSTSKASASFKGQTGMGLEMTNYGQGALRADISGELNKLDKRHFAGVKWLGKVPSAQIPVDQRN
jgi:hypothetical protein